MSLTLRSHWLHRRKGLNYSLFLRVNLTTHWTKTLNSTIPLETYKWNGRTINGSKGKHLFLVHVRIQTQKAGLFQDIDFHLSATKSRSTLDPNKSNELYKSSRKVVRSIVEIHILCECESLERTRVSKTTSSEEWNITDSNRKITHELIFVSFISK